MRPSLLLMVAVSAWAAQWPRTGEPKTPPEPPEQSAPTPVFRTGTSAVKVDVQVTDSGRAVRGLTAADFTVSVDGEPRAIDYFGHDVEPLQLILLLDVSGSMGKLAHEMATVGRQALAGLNAGDEVGVAVFSRRSRWMTELTSDKSLAARALLQAPLETDLGAGTAINDVLLEFAGYLTQLPAFAGRRAIVILTDNAGAHFRLPDEKVIRALQDAGAVLNAIVPPGARPPEPPKARPGVELNPDFTRANVFHLAEATGGEWLRAERGATRFAELLERIRLRYDLGIQAGAGTPGRYHELKVDLTREARRRHPKAELRSRAGYFSPDEPAPEAAAEPPVRP